MIYEGIGYETALKIADQGFLVFAGCRQLNPEIIQKFKGRSLKVFLILIILSPYLLASGLPIVPLQLDVTKKNQFEEAFNLVSQRSPSGLWAIINNAGVMTHR